MWHRLGSARKKSASRRTRSVVNSVRSRKAAPVSLPPPPPPLHQQKALCPQLKEAPSPLWRREARRGGVPTVVKSVTSRPTRSKPRLFPFPCIFLCQFTSSDLFTYAYVAAHSSCPPVIYLCHGDTNAADIGYAPYLMARWVRKLAVMTALAPTARSRQTLIARDDADSFLLPPIPGFIGLLRDCTFPSEILYCHRGGVIKITVNEIWSFGPFNRRHRVRGMQLLITWNEEGTRSDIVVLLSSSSGSVMSKIGMRDATRYL